jgi:hypothetical protein
MRPQRQMWICGAARAERISLGRGWQVRIPLRPWRSKVPVPWTAPIVGRRPAGEHELALARAYTPGWPPADHPGHDEAFVLIDSRGDEWTFPQGVRLVMQRLRTPARDREARGWRFT